MASITFAFVYLLHVAGLFLFNKLLSDVGGFERYAFVGLFKKICDFPYFGGPVCEGNPYLLFVLLFLSWLDLLCFIFWFRLSIIFLGKLFCAICCINFLSLCFRSRVSGKECILVM